MSINIRQIISLTIITGWAIKAMAQPVDSILPERKLQEVSVTAGGPRHAIAGDIKGTFSFSSKALGQLPSFFGGGDAISLLRSMPSIATNNDLQASMSIRGSGNGANLFESDGVRIINPLHMLGFYSAFNPAYYRSYTFAPGYVDASTANLTGGYLSASTPAVPDSTVSGSVSIGLIESHGAIHIPLIKNRTSLSLGFRQTYLNLIYPSILTLGTSHLRYDFSDINAALLHRIDSHNLIKATFFANRDNMSLLSESNGARDGSFGWGNMAGGLHWTGSRMEASIAASHYRNSFKMTEAGKDLDLPSSLLQLTARASGRFGGFLTESDFNYRYSSGQRNAANAASADNRGIRSVEWNIAATRAIRLTSASQIEAGLRLSTYHTSGYTRFIPMPRINIGADLGDWGRVYASYGRHVRFNRLIEESDNGLPTDFWSCVNGIIKPEDTHSFSIGISGLISPLALRLSTDIYYKRILNAGEFSGTVLDMVNNSTYDPTEHIFYGHGYACGLSLTAMRQTGRLRGRLSYNIGTSKVRIAEYGSGYIPSAHDRLHDLNATLSWIITPPLSISASFTYATGTPYTQARYGYMIGENLICEYFPHNSSRLPDYRRLDFSATWQFGKSSSLQHSLNLSVYNALASHNVLFRYSTYSKDKGIEQRESVMKTVIPSITYTLEF